MAKKIRSNSKAKTPDGLRVRNKEIRRARVGDIEENPRNHRTHDDLQRESFRATRRRIGFFGYPDVFETEDGRLRLVDGELRLQDLIDEFGEDAYIDVNLTDFSEAEAAKALVTKDALAAMAGINTEKLDQILRRVHSGAAGEDQDFDRFLETMAAEHSIALDEALQETERDAEPEIDRKAELQQKWGTERGQLWSIRGERAQHWLLCGDSEDPEDYQRLCPDESPFLMVTDPPYGVDYDPTYRSSNRTGTVANDHRADWTAAYRNFAGAVAYVWHGNLHATTVAANLIEAGLDVRKYLIWGKPHFAMGRGHYHWQHEPVIYAVRPGYSRKWRGGDDAITFWSIAHIHPTLGEQDDGETIHGTQKPVECMRRPIRNHGDQGDAIYDPFVGSGTTIISAENEGRTCYAMEHDPGYVAVTLERASKIGCECERV